MIATGGGKFTAMNGILVLVCCFHRLHIRIELPQQPRNFGP
jgi:hypothetical protein